MQITCNDCRPVPAKGIIAIGQFEMGIITTFQFGLELINVSRFTVSEYALPSLGSPKDLFIIGPLAIGRAFFYSDPDAGVAGLSHGLGIPAVDSLILAGFLLNGSETIYTTDAHLEKYVNKGVQVIKL